MSNEELDIITVGESLIELSSGRSFLQSDKLDRFYGGDALCASIAASRLGAKVGYISRIGNDCFKEYLLDSWQAEGLDISQVKLVEGTNGLYIITYKGNGEREFSYYRKKSAACSLCCDDVNIDYLKKTKIFYTTGIQQALSLTAKEMIKDAYKTARINGIKTAYRLNFIEQLISKEEAIENFNEICENLDILFFSLKDSSKNLFDIDSIDNLIKYFWDLEISTVVVKNSKDKTYHVGTKGSITKINFYADNVIDTTCSSDAFAGAFLCCVSKGMTSAEATKIAAIVEGLQAQKVGAIKSIPQKEEVYKIYKGLYE